MPEVGGLGCVDRPGWSAFASAMTLVAVAIVANGFLLTQGLTDDFEEQSRAEPPRTDWYHRFAGPLTYAGAGLVALGIWPMAYGWAKVRAKTVLMRRNPAAPTADEAEEVALQPPGFFGPIARTRRVGAVPLTVLTLLGLGLAVAAAVLLYFGVATFEQTSRMEGRGLRTAVFWGQLVKFGALPLAGLAAMLLALAWGRWFPLGEVEVVETAKATAPRAATGYRFDRQV